MSKPIKNKSVSLIPKEVLPLEECRRLFAHLQFSDKQLLALRNNLIGIVTSLLTDHLEGKN